MNRPSSPAQLFGPLFAAVQERGLFADSKTFADAIPRYPAGQIMSDWQSETPDTDAALRAFVASHFDVPAENVPPLLDARPLAPHICALWDELTRTATSAPGSSEIDLPKPFVVPGGRFRELYYWDSYFTMLGLARSGRQELIEDMIVDFGSLLDRFGCIPNGTRSYYLTRSHPPFFYLMAGLSRDRSETARRSRLRWMEIEHAFWMDGAEALPPDAQTRRVVRMADGSLLNRYWDDSDAPRDESWREDIDLAASAMGRKPSDLWRDIRASAESGWDFSSRWLADGASLATIRTTRIVPIDLNCLLCGLEQAISREAALIGQERKAARFSAYAWSRNAAIASHLWDDSRGHYSDFDLDSALVCDRLTGAAAFPLFVGIADETRALHTVAALTKLLRPGGLVTTPSTTGEQWDAPNGWAPLQWIAVAGLRRYGENTLADEIANRWLAMVEDQYRATGQLLEKYDVEQLGVGTGGEYVTETGFGWTNGVALELLATRSITQNQSQKA
ncbi:MAG: alpha,alpha-trehalase TreF [Pseudomonadota bacterium]